MLSAIFAPHFENTALLRSVLENVIKRRKFYVTSGKI